MKKSAESELRELRINLESESDAELLVGVDSLGRGSLTPEAEEVTKEILRGRGVAIPNYEACPRCGVAMTRGTVVIKASVKSFLAFGLSSMALYFRTPGEKRRVRVLTPGDIRRALRCDDCGVLITAT